MYTKNAELKAGIVVLLAVAALLSLLWLASGAESLWAETREIQLRFKQGFAAPKEGDPVLMNGKEIGRIVSVVEREETRHGASLTPEDRAALRLKAGEDGIARELYVLATARLPGDQKIPEGTTAEINVTLTGSRVLSLMPGLSPRNLTDEDMVRRPIPAAQAGDLGQIMRSIDRLVDKVSGVVDRAGGTLDEVKDVVATLRKKIDSLQIEAIQGNVLDATGSFKDAMATLKTRLDDITSKVAGAAGDVRSIAEEGKAIVHGAGEDLHAILESLRAVASDLKALLQRTGPKVDTIFDELAKAARSASAFGADAEKIGPQVRAILGETGADVDRVLGRIKEVAQNLQDASEDLRAHPWKLLNKPDASEIAYENLRNAAANYVRAAARVQETTEDLKILLARKDLPEGESKRLLSEVWARLKADEQKYSVAEEFFQRTMQGGPSGATTPSPAPPPRPK